MSRTKERDFPARAEEFLRARGKKSPGGKEISGARANNKVAKLWCRGLTEVPKLRATRRSSKRSTADGPLRRRAMGCTDVALRWH
jgi:hypothetical protein